MRAVLARLRLHSRHLGLRRFCSCCQTPLKAFTPYPLPRDGVVSRPEARCPVCGSLERHRLMMRFLRRRTDLFDGRPRRILHIAPEGFFAQLFQRLPHSQYVSLDLSHNLRPTLIGDLTRLPFAGASFNVIYCSHVLEHVPDDRAAMRELRRVLAPNGWAILQVPVKIADGPTYEDPTIVVPEERLRVFGQEDHVRIYGNDYPDRLRGAGFAVVVDQFARSHGRLLQRWYGLTDDEDVYVCR